MFDFLDETLQGVMNDFFDKFLNVEYKCFIRFDF